MRFIVFRVQAQKPSAVREREREASACMRRHQASALDPVQARSTLGQPGVNLNRHTSVTENSWLMIIARSMLGPIRNSTRNVSCSQGLTSVHFSGQREQFHWDTFLLSVHRRVNSSSQTAHNTAH
jgi:hypothetical protein